MEIDKEAALKASTIGRLECLVIKHKVAWPLNIVISEESTGKYTEIFVFLLQLVRSGRFDNT